MIKFLIERPVAVLMSFTAVFILGIITYLNIPVSLLPDIDIPEISVHITGKDNSARELENTVVNPLRQQLLQVVKLRDIHSETRDGSAVIRLSFEYGVNTELAFVDVNEKIDAAMGRIPRGIERPRVVKSSATDIPVFNLNLSLKADKYNASDFLEMSSLVENIIRRRIEQLPQVALVDMTGLLHQQVLVTPDAKKLQIAGIGIDNLEEALNANNTEPGSLTVKDGYYEYNIRFPSVMRTVTDMQNIFIRKNEKIYQLKDLAKIDVVPEKLQGEAYYNGKRAITLAVIKQSGENMDNLKETLNRELNRMQKAYPTIDFNVSQNQTELLDYTISNLKQNLLLAFIFICLVSVLFMRDIKSPFIIGVSMFVSLILSLLFFYLFRITLNVVSLTGLILAFGNMIDSSIIVTDNISQYRKNGRPLDESCIKGVNEVIAPMLSSSFTSIAVFVPLIFLSGMAGAIFSDQAFSVTIGLLVSYVCGIMLLPVLYKIIFSLKTPAFIYRIKNNIASKKTIPAYTMAFHEKMYHKSIRWIFRNKVLTFITILIILPLNFLFFNIIPKEKMPDLKQNDVLMKIDWNENIYLEKNSERVKNFIGSLQIKLTEHSALVGQQQYLLNNNQGLTVTEAEVYLKVPESNDIPSLKSEIEKYFAQNYPLAIISFTPATTIFEKIFSTGEPDLVAEYYNSDAASDADVSKILTLKENVERVSVLQPVTVPFQNQLNLSIDKNKLIMYGASYIDIYKAIKTGLKQYNFAVLRSNQYYLPIVIGQEGNELREILENTMINVNSDNGEFSNCVPLSVFVNMRIAQDVKTIVAGKNGEFTPMYFYNVSQPEKSVKALKENVHHDKNWDLNLSGSFFSNKTLLKEMIIILFISLLLMYFILAAQFENLIHPLIVLLEIPIDIAASLALLLALGYSLNLMSAIGIVVSCGIIINDSILKVDIMNQLRKSGLSLMDAIHEAGHRRLNSIIMTSLTSIVCMLPLFFTSNLGTELEKPLAIAIIGGMLIGTPISLFVVPLAYWWVDKMTIKLKIKKHS